MPAHSRPRLFLTSTMLTSFIEADLQLLAKHFTLDVAIDSGIGAPLRVLRGSMCSPLSLSWFASTYSFFMVLGARLAHRSSAIILGGVDTVDDRALGYGVWRTGWKRPLLRYAVKNAGALFAVDEELGVQLRRASGIADLEVTTIPTGYDPEYWTPGDAPRERMVLCVATADTMTRARVKGLDLLAEVARLTPDLRFEFVGVESALARQMDLPPNATARPPVPREQLREIYRRSAVYCQPSRYEGLPNALCESMLCGCVPVGTRTGGVARAIGDAGFVVEREDIEGLAGALHSAIAAPPELGLRARARVAERYPLEARERRLIAALLELLDA